MSRRRVSAKGSGKRKKKIERGRKHKKKKRAPYLKREKDVSVVFHTLTVSTSSPTSSSRCVVKARPSISGLLPAGPTRSVMSKMMLVKPSWSIQTSWLSGTSRSLLLLVSSAEAAMRGRGRAWGKGRRWRRVVDEPDIGELLGQVADQCAAVEGSALVSGHDDGSVEGGLSWFSLLSSPSRARI